jgi:hypothetical protein
VWYSTVDRRFSRLIPAALATIECTFNSAISWTTDTNTCTSRVVCVYVYYVHVYMYTLLHKFSTTYRLLNKLLHFPLQAYFNVETSLIFEPLVLVCLGITGLTQDQYFMYMYSVQLHVPVIPTKYRANCMFVRSFPPGGLMMYVWGGGVRRSVGGILQYMYMLTVCIHVLIKSILAHKFSYFTARGITE